MKRIVQLVTAFLVVSMVFISGTNAATINAASCSQSNVQTAINAAKDGDTISVPAGSCSWSTPASWTNKNISVIGAGIGNTVINGPGDNVFDITDNTKASFRVSGMTINEGSIVIDSSPNTTGVKGWRIDHVRFSYASCGQNVALWINGINWGLIHNSQFNNAGNAIFIRSWVDGTDEVNPWPPKGLPGMGGYSWQLPLNLGSDEAVYVEDSTFTLASGCYYGVDDMYHGGRMVFRHNTVTNAYFQSHSARGYERGGNLKVEIYNNDFNATDSNWYRAIHLRSGTGVIYNNTLRGYFTQINVDDQRSCGDNISAPWGACDGTHAWDGNTPGETGWPCLDQIGRGPGTVGSQPSIPMYFWNNGSSSGCSTNGSCSNDSALGQSSCSSLAHIKTTGDSPVHTGGVRDYVNNGSTPKPGYTPYTYPHPLRASTPIIAPMPPSNLRITN